MRMRLLALVATFAAAIGLSACEAEKPVTEAPPPLPEGAVFELFVVNEDQDKAFNIVFVPDESYGDMNVAANRQTLDRQPSPIRQWNLEEYGSHGLLTRGPNMATQAWPCHPGTGN